MGRLRTIGRRSFLIGSAAVMGGVAFGTYMVQAPHDNPLAKDLAEGSATFNPWVLISPEKITLIAPHADKGQGVSSAQAALIAEELDVEFGQFEVSFGKPDPAYWNHAMSEEGLPFKSTDDRWAVERARATMGGALKVMGMQGTGGSTAMADSFHKLREAGAAARETLKLAASNRTGVPVSELKTANAAVQLPDGTEIKYTELAGEAAQIEPVRFVKLRDPSEWRLIGKPMQRLDILGKSTGTLDYGIDVEIEGMVHATICVNPRQGGVMKGYKENGAREMRGVIDIVEITNGVAVVADNTWRAFQAINAIECDWGDAPYPHEQADHWTAIEDSFVEAQLDDEWRNDGDVDAASGEEITAEYRSPYVAHAPMEPLNAIVQVTDARVDIWTGHQMPIILEQQIAALTEHDVENVHFHNQWIGGSFGHRLELDYIKQAAEIANQMRGTPVKMTYTREEDFAHDFPRHIAMGRASGKVADGKVVSMSLDIAAPSVLGSQMSRVGITVPGADAQIPAGSWNNPYALANFRMRSYRAPELAPVSSWRAVGAPGAGFFFDSFLDELIHAAGADPMEERLRLINHKPSRKVLEEVAALSNWGSEMGENQGRGVAFIESFGAPVAEVIEVTQSDAGIKIDKAFVVADVGTVVDPINFENLVMGGAIFGMGHAMNCEITYSDGMAEQSNYHAHEAMRMYQCPEIVIKGLENGHKIRGMGEPTVPPAAPALGNAIFAATGQRIREMPFHKHIDFV
ncbi:Isoquinoline 1-oxidoreductase beta subunit [Candidatus Rhodobacter oscarellae]|uniref:Isoquinoline 1-oxidoreductase beta subunit n=1 Tax=Candidatus Rhodobacter oscarellae TaxID=1675527 RepID=A0A0J9E7T7_9RHOB|nr:molybdopterin cofactor-binding domain-containing protein [Candidatus Rhodobacter lobularis]KMW58805.1 Isoquinoline 1-oxidoreductase beta subunit [Candidatus Rhodobacter lobularis]